MSMPRSGPGRASNGVIFWPTISTNCAASRGIKRSSFQCPPKAATPHYDLTGYERARAIALGAVACNREQIIAVRRRIAVKLDSVLELQWPQSRW